MGKRILLVTFVVLAVGAAAASACSLPDIAVTAKDARAGDRVAFTISDTDPGARYVVYVGNRKVASGSDVNGRGVSGRFRMPRLGADSMLTSVGVRVTHPDRGARRDTYHGRAPWRGSKADLHYVAPGEERAPAPSALQDTREASALPGTPAPAGPGIKLALLALTLLTAGCAAYGFVAARRARASS